MQEKTRKIGRCVDHGESRRIEFALGGKDQPECHYGKDRTDRAERDKTERVVTCAAVASDGGYTYTHRHDEGDRHRSGGNAAGVKSHGKKVARHKGGKREYQYVRDYQHQPERNTEKHTQERRNEEKPNTGGDGKYQYRVGDGGHLAGKHLKVRLGDGYDEAHEKADDNDERKTALFRYGGAHALTHGSH